MTLVLRIESELDERSANAAADRAQRIYANASQDMSRQLSEGITRGAREGGQALEEMANRARRSYQQVGDATDAVAQQERVLREMREQGARGVEVQAERVRRARRQEREAIREAAAAYDEYEEAARRASDTASQGFRGTAGAALGAGRDAADNFVSGFTGASALTRLTSGAGLAGGMRAGFAALGVMATKVFIDQVEQGLQRLQVRDMFQVRMGVDESTMAGFGREAADAFANGWGTSVADNLRTLQFGVQGGLIDRDAAGEDVQKFIEQTQAMSGILEEDAQQIARGTRNFINTGLVGSYEDAFNLILAANAQGLNISDDLLDTFEEYGTKFRDLGLNGADALGLINQMWEGGARNVDVAADGLKEFAITVTDGSELTGQAFEALGFNAEEMKRRFIEGGEVARTSFGEIITALRELDAEEREQVGLALFKTKWEDMGDAVNNLDLSKAGTELGSVGGAIDQASQRLSEHVSGWDLLRNKVDTAVGDIQSRLANSFIGEIFTGGLPNFLSIVLFDQSQSGSNRPTGPSGPPPIGFTPNNPLLPPGMGPQPATVPPPTVGPGNLGQYQDLFPFLVPPPGGAPAPSVPPATRQAPVPMPDAGAGGAGSESLPPAPVLPIQYTPTGGMPTAVANAQTRLDEAAHDSAEKQARVNQLEQSNIATADDIQKAKNDLLQSQQRQQQAERALQDAQISATEKYTNQLSSATSSMSELGAGLDSDFGISKGLAGIADNFVRFVGSLALAGPMAKLQQISDAAGDEGSGLMGILASNGAFGPQFMPNRGGATGATGTATSAAVSFPAAPGASPRDFAHSTMMPFWQGQGLTVGDHAADQYGEHQNGALDIMVDSIAEGNTVLRQVLSDPNVYGAIFNNQTYGYGQGPGPRPYSGGNTGDPTQDHQDHVHVWYKPGGSDNIAPGGVGAPMLPGPVSVPSAAPSTTTTGFGGIPVPLPVIIVGGLPMPISAGGAGFSPPIGTPASGQGVGPAPGPGVGGPGVGPSSAPLQVPSFIPGGAAGGPLGTGFPQGLPGLGGQAYPSQGTGGGGIGMGGMAMDAAMLGTSALDMMAPGAGAAAKIGIQLANRTIKYAGQVAGIGVSGLMETFLPAGDNPKASIGNSWFGKIAGGIASAAPAIPNAAGGKPKGQDAQSGAKAGGNTINNTVNLTNNRATEDMAGNQAVREMGAMYAPSGTQ